MTTEVYPAACPKCGTKGRLRMFSATTFVCVACDWRGKLEVDTPPPAEETRPMQLSVIACVSRNGVIGINNRLPVRLPADLRRFRIITSNKPVIMGRKTHESIGKTLANRTNIVLSTQKNYKGHDGSIVVDELPKAYEAAYKTGATHTFVIGGNEIFQYFLPIASKLYLTVIDEDLEGDTFFPVPVDVMLKWNGNLVQTFEKNPNNAHRHFFYILDVPDISELAQYYENPIFEGTYATA